MSIEAMREDLLREYPGQPWRNRVMAMPDYQVMKVYTSIQTRKKSKPKAPFGEQMSLFSEKGRLLFK